MRLPPSHPLVRQLRPTVHVQCRGARWAQFRLFAEENIPTECPSVLVPAGVRLRSTTVGRAPPSSAPMAQTPRPNARRADLCAGPALSLVRFAPSHPSLLEPCYGRRRLGCRRPEGGPRSVGV